MNSENYRQLLNNEYKVKELNQEDFDNTLMHFAMLYHQEQLKLNDVGSNEVVFKEKYTPTFEEFMTNFCKHGITLTNNYTRETISLKDLIRKYKLTNNIKP